IAFRFTTVSPWFPAEPLIMRVHITRVVGAILAGIPSESNGTAPCNADRRRLPDAHLIPRVAPRGPRRPARPAATGPGSRPTATVPGDPGPTRRTSGSGRPVAVGRARCPGRAGRGRAVVLHPRLTARIGSLIGSADAVGCCPARHGLAARRRFIHYNDPP